MKMHCGHGTHVVVFSAAMRSHGEAMVLLNSLRTAIEEGFGVHVVMDDSGLLSTVPWAQAVSAAKRKTRRKA